MKNATHFFFIIDLQSDLSIYSSMYPYPMSKECGKVPSFCKTVLFVYHLIFYSFLSLKKSRCNVNQIKSRISDLNI